MTYSVDPATANPVYSDDTGNAIDITLTIDSLGQTVRYTASANDAPGAIGPEVYNRCKAGEFGVIAAYQHDQTAEAAHLRHERDRLLKESDWTQIPDAQLGQAKVDEWKAYRQALRDLPAATPNPDPKLVVWPTPPG